jgi:hypothetical protein
MALAELKFVHRQYLDQACLDDLEEGLEWALYALKCGPRACRQFWAACNTMLPPWGGGSIAALRRFMRGYAMLSTYLRLEDAERAKHVLRRFFRVYDPSM